MTRIFPAFAFVLLASAAAAEGDVEAGAAAFKRQCVACHVVVDEEGNSLAGRAARTGPNLYGVAGRVAGSVEGYRYSKALDAAKDAGMIWRQESLIAFVQDPTGYMRNALDDPRARSKMAYKLRKEEDAKNIYAFLESLAPEGG